MNFLRTSYELLMNFLQTCHELLMNFLQTSYELLTNFLQTSNKLLTNFLQTSYKLLTNFLQTSYKLLMNFLWTFYKLLTFVSISFEQRSVFLKKHSWFLWFPCIENDRKMIVRTFVDLSFGERYLGIKRYYKNSLLNGLSRQTIVIVTPPANATNFFYFSSATNKLLRLTLFTLFGLC